MNAKALALAALVLAGLPTPARASTGYFVAQNVFGGGLGTGDHVDDYGGLTCGFDSGNDPTGVIVEDPNKQTGEVKCGSVFVVNQALGTTSSVSFSVTICTNDASCSGGGVVRSSGLSGNSGALHDTVSFIAVPGDDVYVCTDLSWGSSKGGGHGRWDAEDATAGTQCQLATSVEN